VPQWLGRAVVFAEVVGEFWKHYVRVFARRSVVAHCQVVCCIYWICCCCPRDLVVMVF
jgi:hypothetical protein